MITVIYRLIVVYVIAMVCWNMFTEKKLTSQMNCTLVLIPLVLRALMIK